MKLITNFYQIWRGYDATLRYRVLRTWIRLLMGNRFCRPTSGGVTRIVGRPIRYSHRGSLYGMFSEIFIEQNYYLQSTTEPIRIIDAGANIGMASLYFSLRAPQATIVAFEPNPATAQLFQENINTNNLPVTLHMVGLAATDGVAALLTDVDDAASQSASVTGHLEAKARPMVPVDITLERLSPYLATPTAVLKLDIEGVEGEVWEEVIAAGQETSASVLFIEYHYDGVHTTYPLGRFLSLIEQAGYEYVLHSNITFPYLTAGAAVSQALSYKVTAWRKRG